MREEDTLRPSLRRRRRGRELAAAFAVLVLIGGHPAEAAPPELERVGTLPITPGEKLIVDGRARQLLEIGGGQRVLTITAFDADRLKRTRSVTLDPYWPQRPRVAALDIPARRLYLVAYTSQVELDNGVNSRLISIDVDKLKVVSDISLMTLFPPGIRILGMTLEPRGGLLIVAQAIPRVNVPVLFPVELRAGGVTVTEIKPMDGTAMWGPNVVRGCQAPITYYTQSEAVSTAGAVFVGCAAVQVASSATPGVQAVAAVSRADPADQELFFLPGSYGRGDVYADPVSGRLLLVGSDQSSPVQAVWVFDAAHRAFVGQVAAGDVSVQGAGLNPLNGRLYVGIGDGILVTSDRGYQIPQAIRFDLETNLGPITPVPFNSTIVVPTRGPSSTWIYVVFRDPLPPDAFVPGQPTDYNMLDAVTTDSPQYAADAQGFGLRLRRIGGADAALQNVVTFGGNYWTPLGNLTGLKDGNLDLFFSRIVRAHLSEDEATAEAVPVNRDANTESNYGTIRKQVSGGLPEWPYRSAACGDFGNDPKKESAGGSLVGELVSGSASGECSLAERLSKASAGFGGVSLGGLLSIGSSSSGVTLRRDPKLGLFGDVFAEARNVTIAGEIHIALVRSEVTVAASGMAGRAKGDYRSIFEGVVAGDYRCAKECDPTEAAAAISEQLGAQARVELPAVQELETPRGARGHALRDPWQHQQDIVINNEEETQHQVPALRLTFVNDRSLASRLIVDLAATAGDATSLRVVPAKPYSPPGFTPPLPTIPTAVPSPVVHPAEPPKPKQPDVVTKVVRTLGHGWKVLTAGRSGMLVRSVALWLLFASPLFFAVRRRVLRGLTGSEFRP